MYSSHINNNLYNYYRKAETFTMKKRKKERKKADYSLALGVVSAARASA